MTKSLELCVQLLSTKEQIPFKAVFANNKIIILVDDTALNIAKVAEVEMPKGTQMPSVVLPDVKNNMDTSDAVASTYSVIAEFPPMLIAHLDKTIFSLLADAETLSWEQLSAKYPKPIADILSKRSEKLQKAIEQWKQQHPNQNECPSCISGSINRRLILQLLPFYYKNDFTIIIELIDILLNYVNKGITKKDIYQSIKLSVKHSSDIAINILNNYLTEINNLKSGCTSCAKNAVKRKYNNIIVAQLKEILKNPSYVET